MSHTVRILIFLSLLASIQGLTGSKQALDFLSALSEELEAQTGGLKLLIQDGKDQLPRLFEDEQLKSAARTGQATSDILAKAEDRRCPPEVRQRIADEEVKYSDRFTDCLNLTQKIVDFEKICFDMYNDFYNLKPEVCQMANDMMVCFKESIFKQFQCFSNSLSSYEDEYQKMKGIFTETVDRIHKLVENSKQEFIGCFTWKETDIKLRQQQLLDELCPPLRLGRFRV